MKKIPSLFKRNYDGDRFVRDEVVEGSGWVFDGEGVATEKIDGTCCMVKDGKLYKRHDRKRDKETGGYKEASDGWIACEERPDENTGHWPGWLLVGDGPEDKWHREAMQMAGTSIKDGTYELIGPKVQGNPYKKSRHLLINHGETKIHLLDNLNFEGIKHYLAVHNIEGIVWHHPDGRMVKIKAKDFGLKWPQ